MDDYEAQRLRVDQDPINADSSREKEYSVYSPESNVLTFDLPGLGFKDSEEQIDLLSLAWVLLLYRGSCGGGNDGTYSWGFKRKAKEEINSMAQLTANLTDVVTKDTDHISAALEAIRLIRKTSKLIDSNLLQADGNYELFAAAIYSSTEKSSNNNLNLQIEVQISADRLYVLQSQTSPPLLHYVTTLNVHTFVDIFRSLLAEQAQTVVQAVQVCESELAQLWEWNNQVPPTIDRCMHEIITDETRRNPNRPAVLSWDGELSYGELDRLSTNLALKLSKLGVTIGSIIPLCFEKSMWTIVGVLAVMKAGGGFVLMDPQQPEARLQTIAAEVNAKIIITSEKQAKSGPRIAPTAEIVVVGPDLLNRAEGDLPSSLPTVPASNILYVIFTSGSTGKPKGVVITHANYTSGAMPRAEAVGYMAHSRVLDFASYAFDVSIDCMLCTLSRGGCICVPSDEARINDLSGAIRDLKVNMAHMTPSVARVLATDVLQNLDVLGLGGESVSVGDALAWGKETSVVIAYGPSECTVGCTINNDIRPGKSYTSIGKGVGGVLWIVDPEDHHSLTPIGAVGELLVEGPIVGEGYINEPEKTKLAFIEDPAWLIAGLGSRPGRCGRLYKTGDLVKYDPDGSGYVVFVGRKDRQVKLRGQRVELAEIEHHLRRRLPPDASIVTEVITPGGKDREPTLVAFIAESREANPGGNDCTSSFSPEFRNLLKDMDNALAAELPKYMVPTAYIPLAEMPLLVSCKIDRKKLQEIGLAMSYQQMAKFRVELREKVEPKTDIDRKMHQLWTQVLGGDGDIGVNDNFFALGGDSLRAMKLVAAARLDGLSLTVAEIFTYPVLSDLASVTKNMSPDTEIDIPAFSMLAAGWEADVARVEAAKLCKLDPALIQDMYPCTPLQEGLMALSAKISEAYIAQRVVELADTTTTDRLKAAFEAVAIDCPILRTRIVQIPGQGLIQVVANEPLSWQSSYSLERYLVLDRDRSMGLGEPLARFAVVPNAETGKVQLVLTMHHALYDGWSMPLVIDRVNKIYCGLKPNIRTPFKNFIKFLCITDRNKSETYWRDQLQGASGRQFPVLPWSGYQAQTDSLLEHLVPISRPSTASTTIATAIRGAWALVAAQYTASDDVIFGETLTGRNAPVPGIEQIEGPIITTVPVRIRVNRETTVYDYLQTIHTQTLQRIPYEHTGLQHIRRLSHDAREACELRTGIVLHPNAEDEVGKNENCENEPANGFVPAGDEEAAREALKFSSYALMLVCSLSPQGLLIMASFDSKVIDNYQMQKVMAEFGRLVAHLCEDTSGKIGDLQFLSEIDRTELWRLSSSGPHKIANPDNDYEEDHSGAIATWIVDPADPERLLPVGAVGELLLERPEESLALSIECPRWLFAGCIDSPGRQRPLFKTGRLAKYNSDGSITFIDETNETPKPQTEVGQNSELQNRDVQAPRYRELLSLWSRVLGLSEDDIGANCSFFDLGGDSIAAMKLVSECRMEGLELTVAQIFRHRHLRDMANILKGSQMSRPDHGTYVPFSTLDISDINAFIIDKIVPSLTQPTWKILDVLPARPLQKIAVTGTTRLPRYSARYELFYLDAGIDRQRLIKSCQELVTRNEILRTVFVNSNDRCYSVVLEELEVPFVEYEIEGDLQSFSEKLCDLDVQTRMPQGSPFVKFLFSKHEDGRSCLILRISHAQYDEICLPPLLRQLSALYEGRTIPTAIPFSHFVNHVVKKNIPKSIQYWRNLLRGSSMSVLRPDVPLGSRKPVAVSKWFDISARPKEITVATIPTAAWAFCLARRLSLRDVTFGEVVSGRNIDLSNCDAVMGPCWQYVPVRVKFLDNWSALDLLNFVQQQHIDSTRFEGIGLEEVVKNCTDWPSNVDWFDSVVHQDVEHVETLAFLTANSRMDTIYPHAEPLREWKIQAFPNGNNLCIEIVTFEPWLDVATSLIDDISNIISLLVNTPQTMLFREA